jgi:hypothetical protein
LPLTGGLLQHMSAAADHRVTAGVPIVRAPARGSQVDLAREVGDQRERAVEAAARALGQLQRIEELQRGRPPSFLDSSDSGRRPLRERHEAVPVATVRPFRGAAEDGDVADTA